MLSKFVLYPSCENVVLPTRVNVVNATVLRLFHRQLFRSKINVYVPHSCNV